MFKILYLKIRSSVINTICIIISMLFSVILITSFTELFKKILNVFPVFLNDIGVYILLIITTILFYIISTLILTLFVYLFIKLKSIVTNNTDHEEILRKFNLILKCKANKNDISDIIIDITDKSIKFHTIINNKTYIKKYKTNGIEKIIINTLYDISKENNFDRIAYVINTSDEKFKNNLIKYSRFICKEIIFFNPQSLYAASCVDKKQILILNDEDNYYISLIYAGFEFSRNEYEKNKNLKDLINHFINDIPINIHKRYYKGLINKKHKDVITLLNNYNSLEISNMILVTDENENITDYDNIVVDKISHDDFTLNIYKSISKFIESK